MACALSLPVPAAPVAHDDLASPPDPYELATRWTLASLSMAPSLPALPGGPVAPSTAAPTPRFSPLPHGLPGTGAQGVPDPGAYALMGLALLAAGLLARRIGSGRGGTVKRGRAA